MSVSEQWGRRSWPGCLCTVLLAAVVVMPGQVGAAQPITLANADQLQLVLETSRPVNQVERGPGPNELLFYTDDGVEIVDDITLEVVRRVANKSQPGFSYGRDGSKTSWLDGKAVVVRDEKSQETTRIEVAGAGNLGRPVLSPDNMVFVVPDVVVDDTGGEGSGSVYLLVFNATNGKLIRKLTIVEGAYGGLTPVFSPDGKTLAVGNRNYRTNLVDTATWRKRAELPRPMTHEIVFSPDGTLLAVAYTDGLIALWSVETGKIVRTADSGCSRVQFLAWNPAGDLLASSGPKGTRIVRDGPIRQMPGKVQLWDARSLELVADLVGVSQSGSVRFSRDGKRLFARFKRDILLPETKVAVWSTGAHSGKE